MTATALSGYRVSKYKKRAIKLNPQPRYAPTDPLRYFTTSDRAGGYQVMDRETGRPVAQVDTEAEGAEWIADKVSA